VPLLLALLLSALAQESATVYRGARLHTAEGPPVDRGVLVVRGRLVEAAGVDVPLPDGARIVDLSGKVLIPGLIDAASRAFLDPADRGPGSPEQDAADGLDFFRTDARDLRIRGVTTAYVLPPAPGLGAAVHLGATPALLKRRVALHLSLSRPGEISTASLRLDAYRQLAQLFEGARAHREAWEKHRKDKKDYEAKKAAGEKNLKEPPSPPRDPAKDVLARALDGKDPLPVRVEAHTADAIALALRLAEEFKLRLVLDGATEAAEAAERLVQAKIPVVAGPVLLYGPPPAELLRHSPGCAAALARAGLPVLALGSYGRDAGASRFLLESAGTAVARGLDRDRALEAVTIGAARALGLDGEVGSLKKGMRADFVVLSGDPFDPRTVVEKVVVDGVPVHERGEGP
jgi:imidazolonepropionase-like amidohydrolase